MKKAVTLFVVSFWLVMFLAGAAAARYAYARWSAPEAGEIGVGLSVEPGERLCVQGFLGADNQVYYDSWVSGPGGVCRVEDSPTFKKIESEKKKGKTAL